MFVATEFLGEPDEKTKQKIIEIYCKEKAEQDAQPQDQ